MTTKAERRRASMYVAQNTYYAENNREVFMGPGCSAGSCKLCTEAITCRNDRLLIFWTYRTLARGEEKYKFLRDLMKVEPVQTAGQKPRKRRIRYHLPVEEALVPVCRKMFLHTMAISSRQIFRVLRQGGGGKGKMRKLGGKGRVATLKTASSTAVGHKQVEAGDGGTSIRRKHSKEKENGWEMTEDLSRVKNVSKEEYLVSGESAGVHVSASQSDFVSPRLGAGPLIEIRPNAQEPGDGRDGPEYNKGPIKGSEGKGIAGQEMNSQVGQDKDEFLPSERGGKIKRRSKTTRSKKTTSAKKNINKGPDERRREKDVTTEKAPENSYSGETDMSVDKLVFRNNENKFKSKDKNGWKVNEDTGGKDSNDAGAQQMCDFSKKCDKDSLQQKDTPGWKGGGLFMENGDLHKDQGDEDQDWVEDDDYEEEELGLRLEDDDEEEGEF
ncbi:uncharacterized protein LOC143027165 [Oratosquilla oratoria]|uniref:uncharacterized protein LOC143027165 n=1 Tax=Oratosquilla oratoria TaxID=337810 RepID=UPI003F7620B8